MENKNNIRYRFYQKPPDYIKRHFPILFKSWNIECEKDEFCWLMLDGKTPIACVYGDIEEFLIDAKGSFRSHLSIFKFEVRKTYRRLGYGRIFFNWILHKYDAYKVGLNFLDDDALKFWHKMGLKRQRGTDYLVKKYA